MNHYATPHFRCDHLLGALAYLLKLAMVLPKLRGFDVVQIINPMFLELKAERMMPVYRYLRRNNGKMFMGAFGMDYYWVDVCCKQMPLRYSDFNIGKRLRTDHEAMIYRALVSASVTVGWERRRRS